MTPGSVAVSIQEFETLFLLKQSEVHLLFTFQNHYVQRFTVEALPNLFRSAKKSTNIHLSVISDSYANVTLVYNYS